MSVSVCVCVCVCVFVCLCACVLVSQSSPSPPGWLYTHVAKPCAEGREGLANIALDHVALECQLHVPVN